MNTNEWSIPDSRSELLRERGAHGRPDRERHLRRNLIDSQTTVCAYTAEMATLVRMHIYEINQ